MSAISSNSRRFRRFRSPSGNLPSTKRSKNENFDSSRFYTSISVKNLHPRLSNSEILQFCQNKFFHYGPHKVKIFGQNQQRFAVLTFDSPEDAKRARHATTGLFWANQLVTLEPFFPRQIQSEDSMLNQRFYRQIQNEDSNFNQRFHWQIQNDDFISNQRSHRQRSSSNSSNSKSSRNRNVLTDEISRSHSTRTTSLTRRNYSPYIPLPPDLVNYVNRSGYRQQSTSPSRSKKSTKTKHSESRRSRSSSSSSSTSTSSKKTNQSRQMSRTLIVDNLDRDVSQNKIHKIFSRYGTIEKLELKKMSSSSKRQSAVIIFENVDMANEARDNLNGTLIGKNECKIDFGR